MRPSAGLPSALSQRHLVQAQQAGQTLPDCSRLGAAEVAALAASALLAIHREYSIFASPVVPGAAVYKGWAMQSVNEATPGPDSRLHEARDSGR